MRVAFTVCSLAVGLTVAAGCRGNRSEKPPVHLNQNMDHQQRYDAQEASAYFRDGRAMRTPPEGTVAVGALRDDDHLYRGRGLDGRLIDQLPASMKLDRPLLDRGEDRFNIYCAPCHGETGRGDGIATRRGGGFKVQPKDLHEPRLRAMPLGYFFKVISEGQGTMLSYGAQVPVRDRWAIAAWVRALQVSQAAGPADVPEEVRSAANNQPQGAGGAR